MSGFFGFLAFLAFVAFILGLIKPTVFVFWTKKKTRGMALIYLAAFLLFVIIAAASSGGGGASSNIASSSTTNTSSTAASSKTASSSATASSSSAPAKAAVKTWGDGQYKVGTDIPAGEYVVVGNGLLSYLELAKDSSGSTDSIIANDDFSTRDMVTASAGQYLTIKGGTAYAVADAPKVDTSSGTLSDGMYKVGTDLPAGEYQVTAGTSGVSYVEVAKDSTHTMDSIVTNDIVSGNKYVTVKDGQYLTLKDAKLKLK